jgi:2-methylcitrate dehydratase PrpD
VIDAARALRATGVTDLEDVETVIVEASRPGIEVAGIPHPVRGLEGRFSLAYTVVPALLGRPMTPETFTDAAVASAEVAALLPRVVVEGVKD